MRRIIVCGSRDWSDMALVVQTLGGIQRTSGPFVLVHGDCTTGADRLASRWARVNGVKEEPHSADWEAFGRAAGPRRNREMAQLGAALCVAFWDGVSRGTADMIRCAREAGIAVRIVAPKSVPYDPEAFA